MMAARHGFPARIPRAFLCVALGVASAMCFVVDTEGYVGMSALPAASTSYLWSALALCFALLLYHVHVRRGLRPGVAAPLLGLLFGVLNTFGGLLFAYDSWAMLLSPVTLAMTLLRSMGQAVPMAALLAWVDASLRGGRATPAGHAGCRARACRAETPVALGLAP